MRGQVLPLYLPALLSSFSWGVSLLAFPLLARELGADIGQTGVVVSLCQIGGLIAALPAGYLTARWSYRATGLISALGFAALSVIGWLASGVWTLAFVVFGMGAALVLWEVSRHSYARDTFVRDQRGRLMAVMGGVHRLGHLIGPAVAGVLAVEFGLRILLPVMGILFVMAAVASAVFLQERRPDPLHQPQFKRIRRSDRTKTTDDGALCRLGYKEDEPGRAVVSTVKVIRGKWRILIRNGLPIMILGLVRNARQVLLPLWGEHIGLEADAIGFAMSASWALDFLVFYVGGLLSDQYGRRVAAFVTLLLLSASLALLPLSTSFVPFVMLSCLSGLANGFSAGVVMTMGADLAPEKSAGQFLGIWRLVANIGASAGSLVVGRVGQVFSLVAAAPAVGAIGIVGAALFAFVVQETGKPKAAAPRWLHRITLFGR